MTEHVPEVRGSGYDGATVRHLLDMTAVIDLVEDYAVDFWRASASRPKASLPRTPIQTFAPDDEEERGARLLLLGKAAVLAHRTSVRWLLSWTTTSSRDAVPAPS